MCQERGWAQKQDKGSARPIAFASLTLQPHECNYRVMEMKVLGVVWAVKQFGHYLYGHRCTVFTNHEALNSLLNIPHPSGKLARWGLAFQELNLRIQYRPGKHNANADAISRSLSCGAVEPSRKIVMAAVTDASTPAKNREYNPTLAEIQEADPDLQLLWARLKDQTLPQDDTQAQCIVLGHSQYARVDNILYHWNRTSPFVLLPPPLTVTGCSKKHTVGHLADIWSMPRLTASFRVITGSQR